MSLRCLDASGQSIHSFDLSENDWQALAQANQSARHLRMPCCAAAVTMKRSRLGTPFFAHKSAGACATAPEREEHLRLKKMAVTAARANGWEAAAEVTGAAGADEPWRADVLASKGKHRVAVEIQWSDQAVSETMRRQERYRISGVRGLWLLRRGSLPVSRDLPAAFIKGDPVLGFSALLPGGHQELPMEEFLDAAFAGRFRYGLPIGSRAKLSVCAAWVECWHARCRARTRILTQVEIACGPNTYGFSVADLGRHPQLLHTVLERLPSTPGLGAIKRRDSQTRGESYMSNGCVRCDRIYGEHFEIHARYDEKEICSLPLKISRDWLSAIEAQRGGIDGWNVYPLDTFDAGST